jgi:hypothetical protein
MLGYFLPQMVLRVAARYRVGSSVADALPAFLMALINLYISVYAIRRVS